ncbi:MAG: hypothetical protein H7838_08730 [Magnetococcus sp. DMHC-8]
METKRIKAARVREIFGDCSTTTVYRMWKEYKILPPPTVIRGINYWTLAEVEQAFQGSQKAEVKAVTTPAQAIPAPIKSTPAERAANARRGRPRKVVAVGTEGR